MLRYHSSHSRYGWRYRYRRRTDHAKFVKTFASTVVALSPPLLMKEKETPAAEEGIKILKYVDTLLVIK